MPTATFKTVSSCPSVPSRESEQVVIGAVSKYLSYGDTTDLFGYHGRIDSVEVSPRGDSVVFEWSAPVSSPEDVQRLEDEMSSLSHVRNHECLTNPNL
jgi:hypothetical protein